MVGRPVVRKLPRVVVSGWLGQKWNQLAREVGLSHSMANLNGGRLTWDERRPSGADIMGSCIRWHLS